MRREYKTNPNTTFLTTDCGFDYSLGQLMEALEETNDAINDMPDMLFSAVDYKTTSAIVGCLLCLNIAKSSHGDAVVNPIEKGEPDILPSVALGGDSNTYMHYPYGIEVKCTLGTLPSDSVVEKARTRIDDVNSVTWQSHHRTVKKLLSIIYDFLPNERNDYRPVITGVFYTNQLVESDWGEISGTEGNNTKVSSLTASGCQKLGEGWVAILEDPHNYFEKYATLLKFREIDIRRRNALLTFSIDFKNLFTDEWISRKELYSNFSLIPESRIKKELSELLVNNYIEEARIKRLICYRKHLI